MKLEVGKQYKTRAGHRAVVVDFDGDYAAWHSDSRKTLWHRGDGLTFAALESRQSPKDLISEWVEPKKGSAWVNVYGEDSFGVYRTKSKADSAPTNCRIACVRVDWVEGQFDE